MTSPIPQFTVSPPDVPLEGCGACAESPRDRLIREGTVAWIHAFGEIASSKPINADAMNTGLLNVYDHANAIYPQE